MAIIKSFSPFQNLKNFQTFLVDDNPNSEYFRISEFMETFTGGKNGFLIEGSEFLKETTEVKVEVLDVEGNPLYYEPGDGIPEYYEGVSKLVSVHVYDDTPIGLGRITILGELKNYVGPNGETLPVPEEWKGVYNVKWERTFKINKNLNNETIVRFYKRPVVSIDELVKPIFTKSVNQVTDSESTVSGIAQQPNAGTSLIDYRAGTLYKLIKSSGSWDVDVDENTIEVDVNGTTFSSTIIEVLNDKEVLVDIPYSENNIVSNFTSQSYSVTYTDFQNETIGESALTGSFAKIDITQLKTFVGDVARVKVFRKSRNSAADFQFVQESKLESTELLRDITTTENTELSYGRFDENNLSNYWVTSSNLHPTEIDSSVLSQAVKIDYNGSGVQKLITSQSFSISKDVEYTLNFRTLLSGSISDDKYLKAYFSGSYPNGNSFTQSFVDVTPDGSYVVRKSISENILAEQNTDVQLVFEFKGDDWYISNVSLKNAQDTSFSPDEFTLIQDIPRKLPSETFDFRFEFYDINNNFIPVNVLASKTFDGGNDFNTTSKLLTFESDRNAFRFISGSVGNPSFQQIQFKTSVQNLTGSVEYFSSSFDVDGKYIDPIDYASSGGLVYPGGLTNPSNTGGILTISNFSGSVESIIVGSIVYTASIENQEEFETVYRLEDGDNAPQLVVTSNTNQFIYEPTTLSQKPSGQEIRIRAQRKNLASLITPIEINSGSNTPPLTFVSTENGIDTYSISALEYSSSFADSIFPETTYSFTGSDVFDNKYSDEITISPVINFDGVSLVLSNENSSFPANSTGEITSQSLEASSGSITMFIGGAQIQHNEGLSSKNTFDITNVVGTNCTPNLSNPTTNEYGITSMNADSASIEMTIKYLAGDNETSQSFQKIVSYSKAKKGVPTVLTKTSPASQTINSSSAVFEDPQNVEVFVMEGGDEYFYTTGTLSQPNTFKIISIVSGSDNSTNNTQSGSIIPTKSSISTNGSALLSYVNSEGTLVSNKTVRFDVGVSKIGVDGINGSAGSDAKTVVLTADQYVVQYNGDGEKTPVSITLTATEQNHNGTVYYEFLKNNNTEQNTTSNTYVIPDVDEASINTTDLWEVRTREGSSSGTVISFDNTDIFGLKDGTNAITAFLTNEAHTLPTDNNGNVTYSDSGTSVLVFKGASELNGITSGTPTLGQFTVSTSVTSGTISVGTKTSSGNPMVFGDHNSMTTDLAIIEYTINVENLVTLKKYQTLSKSKQGQDGSDGQDGANGIDAVSVTPSISNQNVVRTNTGNFGTPTNISLSVVQGSTSFSYDGSSPYSNSSFRIANVVSGTNNNNGTITPTTPTTISPVTTTYDVIYKDSEGDVVTQSFTHVTTVTLDGNTGPGVVHTGLWESGRAYQFDDGNSGNPGTARRDSVLYNGTYYAATQQHTSTSSGVTGPPGVGSYWESLGSQDLFVAAKIAIFEDSYVQNTLNIGTNNNGGVSSANITLNGGTSSPYLSIGQSSSTGSQGYNVNGIFLGQDSTISKFSLKNGTNGLSWDGTNLSIKGSITITGGNAATTTDVDNSVTSGSVAAGNAATSASNAQNSADTANTTIANNSAQWSAGEPNPTAYAFGASASGNRFALASSTAVSGLNLNSSFLGYHNGQEFQTYIASNGDFFLSGSQGGLTWDASAEQLTVRGDGTFTGNLVGGSIIGGEMFVPNITNPKFTVDGFGNMTAQDAVISGSFNIQSGILGSWIVDPQDNGSGGVLRDVDSKIIFEPNLPEIQVYSDDGDGLKKKVFIGSNAGLSDTAGTSATVSWSSTPSFTSPTTVNGSTSNTNTVSSTIYTSLSTSTAFSVSAGELEFTNVNIPELFVWGNRLTAPTTPTITDPNYQPTYAGEIHGGYSLIFSQAQSYAYATLYLDVVDTLNGNARIGTKLLTSTSGFSGAPEVRTYIAENSFDRLFWVDSQLAPSIPATNGNSSGVTDANVEVNITSSTTAAKVRYRLVLGVSSNQRGDANANGSITTTITQASNTFYSTSNGSAISYFGGSLDNSIQFDRSNNYVEIQGGGIQVVSGDDTYVRLKRKPPGSTNDDPILEVAGGSSLFSGDSTDDIAVISDGHILPSTDSTTGEFNIGSILKRWDTIWVNNINGKDFNLIGSVLNGAITTTNEGSQDGLTGDYDSYIKLHSGVIIQFGWQYDSNTTNGTVSFPTAFPNALHAAFVTSIRSTRGSQGADYVHDLSRTQMDIVKDGTRVFWMAVGN